MLLGQQAAGDAWHVRWLGFSLNQTRLSEGETAVWDDPEMAATRMAVEVGIAVRDGWPEAFPDVHRDLFAARHDRGEDLRDHNVVADVLVKKGLDPDQVFDEVLSCRPRDVFRIEHQTAANVHKVFGVPTVIAAGHAVFIRLIDRPGADAAKARDTVERCVDLVTGWPNLNEFKHTTIPH
ncbi:MAG TPA: DsbA family protein [Acidimicrobiales bacterium]|nr:DsbA family protein [Acidimicrobiales bacterium]